MMILKPTNKDISNIVNKFKTLNNVETIKFIRLFKSYAPYSFYWSTMQLLNLKCKNEVISMTKVLMINFLSYIYEHNIIKDINTSSELNKFIYDYIANERFK